MAAHALTIVNQILDHILAYESGTDERYSRVVSAEDVIHYADGALGAPGLDPISYPCLRMDGPTLLGPDLYHALYMATGGLIDSNGVGRYGLTEDELLPVKDRVPFIKTAVLNIIGRCDHLKHYRSLEAADSAYRLFVRRGVPHWRKRAHKWNEFLWGDDDYPQPESFYR